MQFFETAVKAIYTIFSKHLYEHSVIYNNQREQVLFLLLLYCIMYVLYPVCTKLNIVYSGFYKNV